MNNSNPKVTVIRAKAAPAPEHLFSSGERVRMKTGGYQGISKGATGTVIRVHTGDRLAHVRFDETKNTIIDAFFHRLESLDSVPQPAPEPKVEKVVVEFTLEEARMIRALIGPMAGNIGYDVYHHLNQVPEVSRTSCRDRNLLEERGYKGVRLNVEDFKEAGL